MVFQTDVVSLGLNIRFKQILKDGIRIQMP